MATIRQQAFALADCRRILLLRISSGMYAGRSVISITDIYILVQMWMILSTDNKSINKEATAAALRTHKAIL